MFGILQNFWVIQGIGSVGLIFVVLAWNSPTRLKIIKRQSISVSIFIIHYFLLGAYSGAMMSFVTLFRNLVFFQRGKRKWANSQLWIPVFILVCIISISFVWNGWISILPMIGVILGIFSISREKPAHMRLLMLLASLTWIPYSIIVHSYSGLINQIVGVTAILVGMYRHDRKSSEMVI